MNRHPLTNRQQKDQLTQEFIQEPPQDSLPQEHLSLLLSHHRHDIDALCGVFRILVPLAELYRASVLYYLLSRNGLSSRPPLKQVLAEVIERLN